MNAERRRYKRNRARAYEIYGVDPSDKNYNIHHIVFKSDRGTLVSEDFDINATSNLIPLKKEDHNRLHEHVLYLAKISK